MSFLGYLSVSLDLSSRNDPTMTDKLSTVVIDYIHGSPKHNENTNVYCTKIMCYCLYCCCRCTMYGIEVHPGVHNYTCTARIL